MAAGFGAPGAGDEPAVAVGAGVFLRGAGNVGTSFHPPAALARGGGGTFAPAGAFRAAKLGDSVRIGGGPGRPAPGLLAIDDGPYGSCEADGTEAYARPVFAVGAGAYGFAAIEEGGAAAGIADGVEACAEGAGAYGSSCGFVIGCAGAYGLLRIGEATPAGAALGADGAGAYGLYAFELAAGDCVGAGAYGFE